MQSVRQREPEMSLQSSRQDGENPQEVKKEGPLIGCV